MASILSRFGSIMSANINAMLDKAEDPEKMIDQNLRELRENLAEVKAETASVMADEQRAKRQLDECEKNISDCERAARNALSSGHEDDARKILMKKQQYEASRASLQETYDGAHINAEKMRAMYTKLADDISTLEARKDSIKGKIVVAKATKRVNAITSGVSKANSSIEDFDRWEEKADKMLDAANAETELNNDIGTDENLIDKYKDGSSADVDAELAQMKQSLGLK